MQTIVARVVSEADDEVAIRPSRGSGKGQGIDAIENAAVSREDAAAVLDTAAALEHRDQQVARLAGRAGKNGSGNGGDESEYDNSESRIHREL